MFTDIEGIDLPPDSAQRPTRSPSILEQEGYSPEQIEAIRSGDAYGACSSLDPDEINVGSSISALSDEEIAAHQDAQESFRHSGWARHREITASVLASVTNAARHARFVACGRSAWVLKSQEEKPRYRLCVNRCRDRFCLPCYQERARIILSNLRATLKGKHVRLLTLTIKSVDCPLSDLINRCLKCFRRLRQAKAIASAMKGGVYFFEVTRNQHTSLWHPHLHILFEGSYIPQPLIKKLWNRITHDSFIVDIRGFPNSDIACGYAAKYVSKGVGCGFRPDQEGFAEVVKCFTGRRLFSTFGTLRGAPLSAVPADGIIWEPISPLWRILAAAKQGDRSAIAILAALRPHVAPDPADLVFAKEDTS